MSRGNGQRNSQSGGRDNTTIEYQASRLRSLEEAPTSLPVDTHSSFVTGLHRRADVLKEVLRSRFFLLVTLLTALVYLFFFKFLDIVTALPVMAAPGYYVLFYALVGVSSLLMGLNVYSLRSRLAKRKVKSGVVGGSSSAAASHFGAAISCSCHTTLLLPLLTSIGVGAVFGIGILTSLVVYQFWILAFFMGLNLYLTYRVLSKIQPEKSWAAEAEKGSVMRSARATRYPE